MTRTRYQHIGAIQFAMLLARRAALLPNESPAHREAHIEELEALRVHVKGDEPVSELILLNRIRVAAGDPGCALSNDALVARIRAWCEAEAG